MEAIFEGPRRYQIRFPGRDAFLAAQSAEAPTEFRTAVAVPRRAVLGVEIPARVRGPVTALRNEAATLDYFAREYGAVIMEDYQYAMDLTDDIFGPGGFGPESDAMATLDDVVRQIRADCCWEETTGEGVVIAVVDTGIDGRHPEFPEERRAGAWQPAGERPWTDWRGHGTMCAAIAAGTAASGGRYNGVAPGARLVACKTRFYDTELAAVYDTLIEMAEAGTRVVATNSYGVPSGVAPPPAETAFTDALEDAISAGIVVLFSAGNYHELTGGGADACGPTSIWQHKCRADLVTVGTCDMDGRIWPYSSRGPGQHFGSPKMGEKPDVVAPTPANGAVLYGEGMRVLARGWGTSGAAPQVAGLAALLLSRRPSLTSGEVFGLIRETAAPLGLERACEGWGRIDCRAALDLLS